MKDNAQRFFSSKNENKDHTRNVGANQFNRHHKVRFKECKVLRQELLFARGSFKFKQLTLHTLSYSNTPFLFRGITKNGRLGKRAFFTQQVLPSLQQTIRQTT